MAVFAVGDLQGCFDELKQLLDRIHFDAAEDSLWFTGDLVNRGPQSLEALRYVKALGSHAVCVLGNHDLHLLAVAAGVARSKSGDTLDEVLTAPDRDELLHWLRQLPLMHHDRALGYTLIHAGLPPQWDLTLAQAAANELETVLRSAEYPEFFRHMYGNEPRRWSPELEGLERLRFIVNCFTRMRYCSPEGDLDLKAKGAPGSQPAGFLPWFEIPWRLSRELHILFGHWSTVGEIQGQNVHALDTGCVWGGRLTALRLDGDDSGSWYCMDCPGAQRAGGD
jgi:bis(5'-nucleosyl)-tetraphosphatase (symmetrical)